MTITPLNREQRELISMFVAYLRSLPEWKDAHGKEQVEKGLSGEYYLLYRLLVWKFTGSAAYRPVLGIPEADGPHFSRLVLGAASKDPVSLWRRKLQETEQSAAKVANVEQELTLVTANHGVLLRDLDRAKVSKRQARRKLINL
jgi:hypothetical protein